MSDEHLHIHPLREGKCEAHEWPTEGLAKRLVQAMRERHGKGGLNVCVHCIQRARDEAKRVAGL
jgi:hypothetical protein